MRNMLSDIQLSCPVEGCDEIVSYDVFKSHQQNCNIAKCEFCDQNVPKNVMNSHQNDCNNFIRHKMAELVVELTETKLERDNANLKLSNANLEIQRLKRTAKKRDINQLE